MKKKYNVILIGLSKWENKERNLIKFPKDDILIEKNNYLILIADGLTGNKLETLLSERLKKKRPIKINEEKIISNVFELPEKLVEDIMIPRTDMISVDANYNINKLIKLIDRTSHSRYPVFEKSRDNIIGMIHIKDVISCWENKRISNIKKQEQNIIEPIIL